MAEKLSKGRKSLKMFVFFSFFLNVVFKWSSNASYTMKYFSSINKDITFLYNLGAFSFQLNSFNTNDWLQADWQILSQLPKYHLPGPDL